MSQFHLVKSFFYLSIWSSLQNDKVIESNTKLTLTRTNQTTNLHRYIYKEMLSFVIIISEMLSFERYLLYKSNDKPSNDFFFFFFFFKDDLNFDVENI